MTSTTPSPLNDTVQQAKALAHPARARILAMLREGPLCVSQLTAVLELAVSTVSGHLSALHRSGLITEEKHRKWVQYGLTNDPERNQLLQQVFSLFERDARVARDENIVRALRRVPAEKLCRAGLDLKAVGVVSTGRVPRAVARRTSGSSVRPVRIRRGRAPW